jgi:hypothetical protein
MTTRVFKSVVVLAGFVSLSSSVFAQSDYFPLDPGRFWVYENLRFGGREWRNEVLAVGGDGVAQFSERVADNILLLKDSGGEIQIQIAEGEFGTFYDFDQESFKHRDVDFCEDGVTASVASRGEAVETPAGTFENCIRIEYFDGGCADAGVGVEWFAPEVGLVKWEQQSIAGPVVLVLAEYGREGSGIRFRRGDVNQDGTDDIGDAVFTLSYLFIGGADPKCLKSADMNDDDKLELTDPVFLLTYLFLGGRQPFKPFESCDVDPSPEGELTCAEHVLCEA